MASSTLLSSSETKNVFLQHISTDIKGIQDAQCNISTHMDVLTGGSKHAHLLCDHLDHILMHGLYRSNDGYWPCVVYFTHKITVNDIKALVHVTSNLGRGRAWLYLALNEQSLECYLRMFIDNQNHVKLFYAKESFLRDIERLSVLLTLISGLDFVSFDLPIDEAYLNVAASPSVTNSGIDFSIRPNFIASVTPDIARKKDLTSSVTVPFINTPQSSTMQSSHLTSSLPVNLLYDLKKSEEVQQQKQQQQQQQDTESNVVTNTHNIDTEKSLKVHDSFNDTNDSVNKQTEQVQSIETSSSSRLSFFERCNQLADQEEEKTSELVLVTRKKKTSKGKKKKKRKEQDTVPNKEQEDTVPPNKEQDTVPLNKNEIELLERDGSLQLLREYTKDSLQPIQEDIAVPNIKTDNVKEDMMEHTIHITDTGNETPSPTITSTNPFDDDNTIDNDTTNNNEYQFGNELSTDYSDQYSLLDNTAAFVKKRRHSPKPQDIVNEENTVINESVTQPILTLSQSTLSQPILSQPTLSEPTLSQPTGSVTNEVEEEIINDHTDAITYNGPPKRPMEITESERQSCDVPIDDNTRIVLSLDVFHHSDERAIRLVQANIPQGTGRYQKVCVVITDKAVYVTQYDGTEGVSSHMIGISYSKFDYILVGLSWQSFSLLYKEVNGGITKNLKQVIVTGSEAVSRSVIDTIRHTSTSMSHPRTIGLKRDDETIIEAIEKELIKLGSETSMEIVRYCMVYWEQLSGESPILSPPVDISVPISGTLSVKEISIFKIQSWSNGYFQLIEGVLYHFGSEKDKYPKATYSMRGLKCGGCTRTSGENKDYAFKVVDTNGSSLVLAAEDEEDMTRWMQALCLATISDEETSIRSPIQKGGAYCAVLLTQNKIHVLKEDWSNGTIQLITSISVQDVNKVCVEQSLPVYCTLSYDDWENESPGMWMLCFSSEYELGQFEQSLLKKYKEIFQVDLVFSELTDSVTRSRAHQAIELLRASRDRSDSITKGRTEFTFDD